MKKIRLLSVFLAALCLSLILAFGVSAESAAKPSLLFENLIRFEEPTGPRFSATLPKEIYDDEKLTEYGFIVMSLEKYQAATLSSSTFTLDADADYLRGINYGTVCGKKVDKHLNLDDSYVTFSCVITNIAEEYFRKGIVARAYAIYDGVTCYSSMFETSYLSNAKGIKNNGEEYDALDADGKELIDYIITCCAEEDAGGNDETEKPEEPSPEEIGGYRFVSYYDVALDDENNWRHFYELYNPYTGEKEYDIPGIESAEKASQLGDAVEAGTLIMFDGEYVDGSTAEEYSYSWLGTRGRLDTQTIVPYTSEITCIDCLSDYFEDNEDTSLVIDAETPISVISYGSFNNAFKWGSIRLSSSEEMLGLEKSVQCYNENALDKNGNYVTKYFKFPKFIYKSTGEQEGGAEVCDFILIVANGDEECALGEKCDMHEILDETENYRIVSNYEMDLDKDDNWSYFYDLYNPMTGEEEIGVQSTVAAQKVSSLPSPIEAGTVIVLSGGRVDETNELRILGKASTDNLVWITDINTDRRTFKAIPCDDDITCPDCLDEYIESYSGTFTDCKGITYTDETVEKLRYRKNTPVTLICESTKNQLLRYGVFSLSDIAAMAEPSKNMLCSNDMETASGYTKTYSKYVKAFVSVEEIADPGYAYVDYIICVSHGDEATLKEKCTEHTEASLTADMEEALETHEPEGSGPAIAGVNHTADEM